MQVCTFYLQHGVGYSINIDIYSIVNSQSKYDSSGALSKFTIMPKIQRMGTDEKIELAIYNDLRFPKTVPGADYDTHWSSTSTARDLYMITASWESAVLFAAREGWVHSIAPLCGRPQCNDRNKQSYLYKRKHRNWV